jgi:hypothetical protein
MFKWLEIIVRTIRSTLRTHRALTIENLALRQQLAILKHRHPRPRLTDADRLFWVVLSQIWVGWREVQDLDCLFAEGAYTGGSGWAGVHATHSGRFLDCPATGRRVVVNGLDFWRRSGDQ